DFEAGAQCKSVDAGDGRYRHRTYGVATPEQTRDEGARVFGIRQSAHFPDIGAANEGFVAGAGEDKHAQVRVAPELGQLFDELFHQRAVHGIETRWIVDGHAGDERSGPSIKARRDLTSSVVGHRDRLHAAFGYAAFGYAAFGYVVCGPASFG